MRTTTNPTAAHCRIHRAVTFARATVMSSPSPPGLSSGSTRYSPTRPLPTCPTLPRRSASSSQDATPWSTWTTRPRSSGTTANSAGPTEPVRTPK